MATSAQQRSIAREIVRNRDVRGLLKYSSIHEVADVLVDHLCENFPDLRPSSDEEMMKFKMQTSSVILDMDHYSQHSASDLEEELADDPEGYGVAVAKGKQYRKLGKRAFATLSAPEKKLLKNENSFLLHHLEEPIIRHLQAKMASYKERGLTQEQIRKEIDKREFAFAEVWYADDPGLQADKAERIEEADHGIDFDRINNEDGQRLMTAYSSLHEIFEYVINHIVVKYPELHPGNERKLLLLKRELTYFWGRPNEDKMKFIVTTQLSPTPDSAYPTFSVFLKKFMKIGLSLQPLNEAEEAFKESKRYMFAAFKMAFPPTMRHLDEKKEFYEASGMSKRQIKQHIGSTVLNFIDTWHADDPNVEVIEASRKRTRALYGL